MNFIDTLIDNGFRHFEYKVDTDGLAVCGDTLRFKGGPMFGLEEKIKYHTDGWFGRTVYLPDGVLIKEDKFCFISLNGINAILTGMITKDDYEEINKLPRKEHHLICLVNKNETFYKTLSGVPPSDEIVNDFLKLI